MNVYKPYVMSKLFFTTSSFDKRTVQFCPWPFWTRKVRDGLIGINNKNTQKKMEDDYLVPTSWPKASEFIQALVGPKCLDLGHHVKSPFLGSMVIQMQTPDIREVFTDKLVTLKVDGERHVLFMYMEEDDTVRLFVMRRNGQILDAPMGTCTKRPGSPVRKGFFTILDCEYIHDLKVWLAFDCIVFRSIPQTIQQDFLKRQELLHKALAVDFLCERIVAKPFFPVEVSRGARFSERILEETIRVLGFPVPHDGLVFQPKTGPYPVGANMNLTTGRGLKWKPDCTLDLVPREVLAQEVERWYDGIYGKPSVSPRGQLVRTVGFYGTSKGWWSQMSSSKHGTFKLPRRLFKLECVSDFTSDFTVVELNKLPLCCNGSFDKNTVVEFEFQGNCVPVERCVRTDKAPQQANKARTVAGVLWQADHNSRTHKGIDDYLERPDELPQAIVIEPPSAVYPVGNPNGKISLDDFVRTGLVFSANGGGSAGAGGASSTTTSTSTSSTVASATAAADEAVFEHEFKVIQTRRPRPGNIFPAELEPNFLATSFVDVLHFDRVLHGIAKKYGKAIPVKVVTVDYIVDDNLRLTAYERKVPTKTGAPLSFFETRGFVATRKAPTESEAKIVDMPDVLKKSGYCYRLDSRTEIPELFNATPENDAHRTFLDGLKAMAANVGKKRKAVGGGAGGNKFDPSAYKGFRLVDRHEFAKERDTSVDVAARVRKSSLEPVRVGDHVHVEYKGRPGQFHLATILKVNPDNTVDVEYDYAVRALTNYASQDFIPIVVDGGDMNKKTLLRVKHRYTFDFPGFKLDLTKTKQVHNFRSTPHVRLHKIAQQTSNCEIEVELLSSIQRVPEYMVQLKDVLKSVFECMQLDENAFLFEKVLTPPPTPALQEAFEAVRKSRGGGDASILSNIHSVFKRATEGLSRAVVESDFFSNLDDEVRALLPPPLTTDPALATRIRWDALALSKWADRSPQAVQDCERRRVLEGIKNAGEEFADMHGLARGALNLAYDPAWSNGDFWKALVQRLRATAIGSVEDDGAVEIERYLRNPGTALDESVLHVASPAAIAFGTMAARALYLSEPRAWWDPQEFALAWNDLLDLASRYATEFYKGCVNVDPRGFISAIGIVDAKVYADFLLALVKLSVLVGAVKVVRDICEPGELPDGILTPMLMDIVVTQTIQERCVYAPRGLKPMEFDYSYVVGVTPRWI